MESKSSRKVVVVISILAFIVVLIGATFAYFTASSRSERDAVDIASHIVEVSYNDGKSLQAYDLIPATEEVVVKGYNSVSENGQCKDDNNRTICSVYGFEVTNLGNIEQQLGAFISTTYNRFYNLKYILYNVTDTDNVVRISSGAIPHNFETDVQVTSKVTNVYIIGDEGQLEQSIKAQETQKYELVLYLNEVGYGNNIEQGYSFRGMVTVSLTDQNHVYGYIEDVNGN